MFFFLHLLKCFFFTYIILIESIQNLRKILASFVYVRPATRKQPSTRTGRPVPESDVPNPKKAFFLSYFGYRTPKKSGIQIKLNRTDTGRPRRVPDAISSEIRSTANLIFLAHVKFPTQLYYVSYKSSALLFSMFFLIPNLRAISLFSYAELMGFSILIQIHN